MIRDREYVIGVALDMDNPLNQFPEVGVDGSNGAYEYSLLDNDGYEMLDVPGLMFDDEDRQLSGTPTQPVHEYRVTYRANLPGSSVFHEAEFTIYIVEIETHVCRTGLNYEETLRVYNKTDKVGSANFTVGADAMGHYVLPIGEKGQQGTGETSTRTFELITVERGGDLAAPDADMLPAGLQVVKLQVDGASVNPLNDLYTRQGFYEPSGAVMPQELDDDGRYADPEPDYPDTDNGMRLAIGVDDASMMKEGDYLSCFIVHDTDDDTGETDSSAVVFHLNLLPDLSARDWVIELEGEGDTSELDVDEAFTTDPSLLNFSVMYVDDGAAKNARGCIPSAAANPMDIVSWSTSNDTVVFTAREVSETVTQRVQVRAELKTGGAEACVQIRITVLPEPAPEPTPVPEDLTAPSSLNTSVDATDPGEYHIDISWVNGANAASHMAMLFDADFGLGDPARIATNQDNQHTRFTVTTAGTYIAVVVSIDAAGEYLYDYATVMVGQ